MKKTLRDVIEEQDETLVDMRPGVVNEQAATRVLSVLRNPLALMSLPDREEVLELARTNHITAEDLIGVALKKVRNT